ncbi:hypothetical protein QBC39DRAFT_435529 [Podospora conica]|nr:hypothetical protein QBC39DRAFT_435529 [Schizothecium conicum]
MAVSTSPPFVVGVTGVGVRDTPSKWKLKGDEMLIFNSSLYNSGLEYNSAAVLKDALPDSFSRNGKPDIIVLKAEENLPAEYGPSRKLIHGLWAGNRSMYLPAPGSEVPDVQLLESWSTWACAPKRPTLLRDDCAARRLHPPGQLQRTPGPEHRISSKVATFTASLNSCDLTSISKLQQRPQRKRSVLQDHNMRISDNASHNLCEWFFYNSLAEGVKRGKPRHVAFIHVPPGQSEAELKAGVEIWQSFIGTLADQIQAK